MRRADRKRRGMVVTVVTAVRLTLAVAGLIVVFGRFGGSTTAPGWATTVMVLFGFVLFIGAGRQGTG